MNPAIPRCPRCRAKDVIKKGTRTTRHEARQQLRRRQAAQPAAAAPERAADPAGDDPDWLALRTEASATGVTTQQWAELRATDNLGAVRATVARRATGDV